MTIQDKRREVVALIDNIKEHSDRLKNNVSLPLLELSVILSKITQLHEKTLILKYLSAVEQQYTEEEFGVSDDLLMSQAKNYQVQEEIETKEVLEIIEEIEEKEIIESTTAEVEEPKVVNEIEPEVATESVEQSEEGLAEINEEQLKEITETLTSEAENWEEIPAKPDVNEAFSEGEDTSVSEQLKKQPIRDLFTAIGINERYLYTNELFDGDIDDFKRNVVRLNDCQSLEQAKQLFNEELRRTYGWKEENEMANALYQLVERRFL